MAQPVPNVRIDAAAHPDVVDAVGGAAEALAKTLGMPRDAAHFWGLATREAVMNAVTHGSAGPAPRIRISLYVARLETLVASVRDFGPGFDPSALPDPRATENVSKGSGRGVFYMRSFCDRVSFSFPRSGGTEVRLEKRVR
jgi:serine/threonine-protein kinase RsbW